MEIVRWAFYEPAGFLKDPWGNAVGFYTGSINAVFGFLTFKGWKFRNYCHVEVGLKVSDIRVALMRRPDVNKVRLLAKYFI